MSTSALTPVKNIATFIFLVSSIELVKTTVRVDCLHLKEAVVEAQAVLDGGVIDVIVSVPSILYDINYSQINNPNYQVVNKDCD